MRSIAILTVVLVMSAGCKKSRPASPDTPSPPPVQSVDGPPIFNQQGDLSFKAGGAMSAANAAARSVNQAQLKDLHLSIFTTWSESNSMPGKEAIEQEAKQNRQLAPLIKEEVIILTGTNNADAIWAYTQYPQRAGEHYVVTKGGVEQMTPEDLKKRLELENVKPKISK